MTIRNFRDHAANERTFLAWVHSSVTVMSFGFLVESFDLFLAFAARDAVNNKISMTRSEFGHVAGLVLIVLGIAMIFLSAVRFARNAREIDQEKVFPGTGSRFDLALAALLIILGGALLFYLGHTLTGKA